MYIRILLLLILSSLIFNPVWGQVAQQEALPKGRVLVLGINKNQFDSNVFYIEELATLNDTTPARVLPHYDHQFKLNLQDYQSDKFEFIAADSADALRYYRRSIYMEWNNRFDEAYVATVSDSIQDRQLQDLLVKYNADYVLTINYYIIYKNIPPTYFTEGVKTRHILHYEVFTFNSGIASAGTFSTSTTNSRANNIDRIINRFAEELIQRLVLFETAASEQEMMQKYYLLREESIKNAWGGGIAAGWGMPYGGFGVELDKKIGRKVEINAGLGYGFSGFKMGAGARYYLLSYGTKVKPFIGTNVIWGTGSDYTIGGRTDQYGTQLDPDDVSEFKLKADGAAYFKVGFRWLFDNRQALMVSGGYGIPFRGYKAEFISGKYTASRQSEANLMAIGGPEAGITYIWYFGR
jgi:hypothetical protein